VLIFDHEEVQRPLHFGGVIKLDNVISLGSAHSLESLGCSKASLNIVDHILNDYLKRFERSHREIQRAALNILLANLLYAYECGKGVLYSRNNSGNGDRHVMGFVDYLAEEGLVDSIVQPPNDKGITSYALPSHELKRQLDIAGARIIKGKNHDPIILRNGRKKELSIQGLRYNTPNKFKRLTAPVELHNNWWDSNSATINKRPIIPYLHRVFNRVLDSDSNKKIDLGGRFYGSYQNIPSADRPFILINGKPTVEIDYTAIHIAILYARAKVGLIGDPYIIDGYERATVKAIMLRLVNSKNIPALKTVITNSAKESRKKEFIEYKRERAEYEKKARLCLKGIKEPHKPNWIDSHIKNIPTGFKAGLFIKKLIIRHSAIEKQLFEKENIGLRLQADDSSLMSAVLNDLYNRALPIPVLPVHDSLICRKTNLELVINTMKFHFKETFGAAIDVKVIEKDAPFKHDKGTLFT